MNTHRPPTHSKLIQWEWNQKLVQTFKKISLIVLMLHQQKENKCQTLISKILSTSHHLNMTRDGIILIFPLNLILESCYKILLALIAAHWHTKIDTSLASLHFVALHMSTEIALFGTLDRKNILFPTKKKEFVKLVWY